ncbi:MAG: hypothetical protein K2J64_00400 [Desulfovibrio sp.]|nr:hypothetical protein [Desulfovibrio sp.]
MNADAQLRELCWQVFRKIQRFDADHRKFSEGFNFSYSPEKSWKITTDILLLTIQPKGHGQISIPAAPWPATNDFFTPLKDKTFQERLLTIPAELARSRKRPVTAPLWRDRGLETFVDSSMVIASFIPFRTRPEVKDRDWREDRLAFAQAQCWARILRDWQPRLILAAGRVPYVGIRGIFEHMSWDIFREPVPDGPAPEDHLPALYKKKFHICRCETSSRKTIYLLGMPNPSAQGPTVYPRKADPFPPGEAPVQKFLRAALGAYPLLTEH